ncbi:MAG: hypothetical protein HC838_12315 [Spirulinaceae cyanobacterium RM2_2_10]|nr:hypothetical protein [Spirulinaceae cyanobacterium SM2_1_0]NJO20656.1 hypothetical protein [Spirulinaceae cyanobacterium RM2_2_10]
MTHLPANTLRRLQRIPQVPFSTWEGDRRLLSGVTVSPDSEAEDSECILWVDGTEGIVRVMDVVSPDVGLEAMVRSLIRAIEAPNSPGKPARPQKIVVSDREIQFFLRGALQDLDIAVDYVPDLPIIDELFHSFDTLSRPRLPQLSELHQELLQATAAAIWQAEPWVDLGDHQIFAIQINRWDVETLYVSLMGMLGKEFGVLLYRSLDSFQRFRSTIVREDNLEQLEQAFLAQDCWFLNFESPDEDEEFTGERESLLTWDDVEPVFGSVHPLEGIRPALDEEEALVVFTALQALLQFFQAHGADLDLDSFPALRDRYPITLPAAITTEAETLEIEVATLPDLATELYEMAAIATQDADEVSSLTEFLDGIPAIGDDLVPENSFLSLGFLPWDAVEMLCAQPGKCVQNMDISPAGEGLPVVMIQTSRPKAKDLIARLESEGGLHGVGFNPGEDAIAGQIYDLGLLRTGQGQLYLFGEFLGDDPTHVQARKQWERRLRKTKGYCGLIVAMGLTGTHRGNPRLRDMLALFEAPAFDEKTLGLGTLQLMPQFAFDEL